MPREQRRWAPACVMEHGRVGLRDRTEQKSPAFFLDVLD